MKIKPYSYIPKPGESFYANLRKAEFKLRAIDSPLRKQILEYLDKHGSSDVTSIMIHLREEQAWVSHNLAVLRKAGLVTMEKEGKNRIYSIHYNELERVMAICAELAKGVETPSLIKREYDKVT